jgi:DNA polymerase (family 10)
MDADLLVVPAESFGAALQYFTGNKYHNIQLRKIAIEKGYKLSEYGLFKGKRNVARKTEKEIYKKLGFDWMPPEMRTNSGELEAAKTRKIPKLIDYGDLKGDLQIQTDWTDGVNSIEEMAKTAKEEGLEYIAITDHTKSLAMTGGLDEKKIERQMKAIDKINKKTGRFKVLKGAEVNIMKDGSLDINDKTLAKLDVVGAAVHSSFKMSEKDMTERIKRAMENPHIDIIFHPTGRVIQRREAYKLDMDALIKHAKKTKTVMEINAYPNRLDLKDEHARKGVETGIKFAIDSDAHNASHIQYLRFGIAQARRGWVKKRDVINTRSWREMLKQLK